MTVRIAAFQPLVAVQKLLSAKIATAPSGLTCASNRVRVAAWSSQWKARQIVTSSACHPAGGVNSSAVTSCSRN